MSGEHPHEHPHEPIRAEDRPAYAVREAAVRRLLVAKGVITADQHRATVEAWEAKSVGLAARAVARAWVDPAFKSRLRSDPKGALTEFGADLGHAPELGVLENTATLHNLVVCTLCSCYPRALLGPPPSWYKSASYRARAVVEPRRILEEFGLVVPDDVEVRVADSTADYRYLVLPFRPSGTEGWTEAELAAVVTRDCLIGVSVPRV